MRQLERGKKQFGYKRLGREKVLENEDNVYALHKQEISINRDMYASITFTADQQKYFGMSHMNVMKRNMNAILCPS